VGEQRCPSGVSVKILATKVHKSPLIKSFAGDSKGGGFSKEPSLAVGDKKSFDRVLLRSSGWTYKKFLSFFSVFMPIL
jgi:hypothetical protein